MISERVIRAWYIPAEVLALRRWLVVATVVNIVLLTFDYLRGDSQILLLGLFGCTISVSYTHLTLPTILLV